ncbi:nuclear transport factor 2 family protein [Nocardia sp. XZ_19_231]|uniref:nuclear transport factor 2 family protein n=1 Tax=Nocardia sp. XZ_19_231 TaxID=2769252 RepID=UPI00188F9734|nr:nuclear transport factor 2 family protein [Nocardia sp. XZ_19_231]
MPDIIDPVAALLAKDAIREVLHSYCRGLDRMDRVLADRVWHPDGTADYGPGYRGSGAGFLDFVWDYHAGFRAHSHRVSNEFIQLDLPSATAASETYVAVWLQTDPQDGLVTDQFYTGRYVDQWSCRNGLWAIDHRAYISDMEYTAHQTVSPTGSELAPWGTRDSSDHSYSVLMHLP